MKNLQDFIFKVQWLCKILQNFRPPTGGRIMHYINFDLTYLPTPNRDVMRCNISLDLPTYPNKLRNLWMAPNRSELTETRFLWIENLQKTASSSLGMCMVDNLPEIFLRGRCGSGWAWSLSDRQLYTVCKCWIICSTNTPENYILLHWKLHSV